MQSAKQDAMAEVEGDTVPETSLAHRAGRCMKRGLSPGWDTFDRAGRLSPRAGRVRPELHGRDIVEPYRGVCPAGINRRPSHQQNEARQQHAQQVGEGRPEHGPVT